MNQYEFGIKYQKLKRTKFSVVFLALGRGQALIVAQAAERAHRKREPAGRQSREHCPYDAW